MAQARRVSEHLDFVERFLHHHHETEDEMLWQKLIARADPELQALIELMGTQHEVVAGCLQRCLPARQAWAATADHDAGAELAGLYDRLAGPLLEHLDAEETRMMPAVAKLVTVGEWAAIGRPAGVRSRARVVAQLRDDRSGGTA